MDIVVKSSRPNDHERWSLGARGGWRLGWITRLGLLLITVLAIQAWVPRAEASETRYVDGISDESLSFWEGNFATSYFRGFFQEAWVNDGHIKFARKAVHWQNWELEGLVTWLDDVVAMKLTPDITVTKWKASEGFPKESEYKAQLTAIIKDAEAAAGTVYIEPWNEPNGQGELGVKSKEPIGRPEKAAEYANWANGVCAKPGCTVVAGNFEDTENSLEYAEHYVANLRFTPEDWGIHPYKAMEAYSQKEGTENDSQAVGLVKYLRGYYGSPKIWITEVGTRQCIYSGGEDRLSEVEGGQRANYLVNKLMPDIKPEHVFYWEFLWKNGEQPPCNSEQTDDALFVPSEESGAPPDRPRPAAAYIYDDKGFPWGYTEEATNVTASTATLTGSIYPGGELDAKYHFEYGTTTSYGSYSGEGSAGLGVGRAAATMGIAGLSPNTTYHYRLVTWNSEGNDTGADGTFYTYAPPSVTTESPSSVDETEATMQGSVNPNRLTTYYHFKWGETTSYGSTTPEREAGSGSGSVQESFLLTELQPGMTYHYRLVATNAVGTQEGSDQTITTYSPLAVTQDKYGDMYNTFMGPDHTFSGNTRSVPSGEWQGPYRLSSENWMYSAPAVTQDEYGDMYNVFEGPDHTFAGITRNVTSGEWQGPYKLSGENWMYSAPAITQDRYGDMYSSFQGPDHTFASIVRNVTTGEWQGPYRLSSENWMYSAPAVTQDEYGDMYVSFEGPGNRFASIVRSEPSGEWRGPYDLSTEGAMYSAPATTQDQYGDMYNSFIGPGLSFSSIVREASTGDWLGPYVLSSPNTAY